MAKNLKVGDKITLEWTVQKVLDDGDVAISTPLYANRITVNGNEVPEEAVERVKAKPKEPEPEILYEVEVIDKDEDGRNIRRTIDRTYDRKAAYAKKKFLGSGVRVQETEMKPRRKR
jgi:hypothetical protein